MEIVLWEKQGNRGLCLDPRVGLRWMGEGPSYMRRHEERRKVGYRKVLVLLLMIHSEEMLFLLVMVAMPKMVRIMSQIYRSPILSG